MSLQRLKETWDEIVERFMQRFAGPIDGDEPLEVGSSLRAWGSKTKKLGKTREERRMVSALLNTKL